MTPAKGVGAWVPTLWKVVEVRVTLPSRNALPAGDRTGSEEAPLHPVQLLLGIGRRVRLLAAGHPLGVGGGKAAHESQQADK